MYHNGCESSVHCRHHQYHVELCHHSIQDYNEDQHQKDSYPTEQHLNVHVKPSLIINNDKLTVNPKVFFEMIPRLQK
uniref:Uncharacterized protein n=1 Tax=Medicago truncatula TaxID=3880 RepID=I3S8M7_MEDTR|nr:unknown [Medicago truncatula]